MAARRKRWVLPIEKLIEWQNSRKAYKKQTLDPLGVAQKYVSVTVIFIKFQNGK